MPVKVDDTIVTVTSPESPNTSIEILKFGATVLSWKVNGEEKLWLSEHSKLDGSKAVRGGIPLVFPRFGPSKGNHPATDKLPQHGFARNNEWEFLGQVDESTVQFGLSPEEISKEAQEQWGYDFKLIATFKLVSVDKLQLSIEVENLDTKPFDFNFLFHTYFRIPDIKHVQVTNLDNIKYKNQVTNMIETKVSGPILFNGEYDSIFENVPKRIVIDYKSSPYFTIETNQELHDAVVWNPWIEKANSLGDFYPKTGYQHMVCVENGSVTKFNNLNPGAKWEGVTTFTAN
ncbi:glucose-6-phosphate 1-epimerase [Starmerella bacillaris]|uniref:Glucose-6-phosphate 1-epimerase n=1 Tax=Starmerella bacillaris TaxID=1247836 RepID=A0AAV5RGN4_STABA|nr:glucose-6-phosphate 1-epimerase [Starmerella bacillaris]